MKQQAAGHADEAISLPQAASESRGIATYQQIWKAVKAGRLEAFQPSGPRGKHKVMRSELERFLRPLAPRAKK